MSELGVTTTRHSVSRFLNRGDGPPTQFLHDDLVADTIEAERERADRKTWGLGGPAVLDLPPKKGDYNVIGLFDMHGEYIEERLFKAQLRHIKDTQPDMVVLGGDVENFDLISRWQHKVIAKMTPIQIHREIRREIEVGKRLRERVRDAAGNALVIEVEGNHCDRLRGYLSDDLMEGWETSKEWRGLEESLDGYYTRAGVFIRPDFLVRHGDTTAQYPSAKELRDSRCSGWTGHLHKVSIHYEPPFHLKNERYVHTVAPATCRLDYNYGPGNAGLARWHQGNVIGSFSASDPHDHITDIGLWNGKELRVRGELY